MTVVVLRQGLVEFAPLVSSALGRPEAQVAVDLMTFAAAALYIGLNAARALGRRTVAERGPAEAERRAQWINTWMTPLFLALMVLSFLRPLPVSAHLAYFAPLLYALNVGLAAHFRRSADEVPGI